MRDVDTMVGICSEIGIPQRNVFVFVVVVEVPFAMDRFEVLLII